MSRNILFILCCLPLFSCEDVVEVDLEESDPRLVVEASLLWDIDKAENVQFIRLTTTAPFFKGEIPPARGAVVSVKMENGQEYFFEEVEEGLFRNDKIEPALDISYELRILYQDEEYIASAELIPTPELLYVEQNNNGGFSGDDIELKVFYQDPANIENHYLFRFFHEKLALQIYDDEFTDGSLTFAFFSEEDLEKGDDVLLEIQGISRDFYQYMYILRSQSGSSNGGPFQTQPTTVRGNIINLTNPENFAFGYFRLSGTDAISYQVQ